MPRSAAKRQMHYHSGGGEVDKQSAFDIRGFTKSRFQLLSWSWLMRADGFAVAPNPNPTPPLPSCTLVSNTINWIQCSQFVLVSIGGQAAHKALVSLHCILTLISFCIHACIYVDGFAVTPLRLPSSHFCFENPLGFVFSLRP